MKELVTRQELAQKVLEAIKKMSPQEKSEARKKISKRLLGK